MWPRFARRRIAKIFLFFLLSFRRTSDYYSIGPRNTAMRSNSHMRHLRKTTRPTNILCGPGQSVKARVVGAGIRLGLLASAADMAQSTLTGYMNGSRRGIDGQLAIADAFRRLTRQRLDATEFWGDLWADENKRLEKTA